MGNGERELYAVGLRMQAASLPAVAVLRCRWTWGMWYLCREDVLLLPPPLLLLVVVVLLLLLLHVRGRGDGDAVVLYR